MTTLMNTLSNTHKPIFEFLIRCSQILQKQAPDAITRQGARYFQDCLNVTQQKSFTPAPLPVLSSVKDIEETPLTQGFHQLAGNLLWRASPRSDDGGTQMALSTLNDMFELGELLAGLLYLDSGQRYPEHQHPPQELYLILTGNAEWRYGGNTDYQPRPPGSVLYNHPGDLHGVKAGPTPLLALYVLWPS